MIRIAAVFSVSLLLAGSALAQMQSPTTGTGGRSSNTTTTTSIPAPATASTTLGTDQFSSEGAAKTHCPSDAVVWVNLGGSKAYHTAGTKYYGKTKHGAYMCQREADQGGFHAGGHHIAAKKPS
jgi:hypothetical protein